MCSRGRLLHEVRQCPRRRVAAAEVLQLGDGELAAHDRSGTIFVTIWFKTRLSG